MVRVGLCLGVLYSGILKYQCFTSDFHHRSWESSCFPESSDANFARSTSLGYEHHCVLQRLIEVPATTHPYAVELNDLLQTKLFAGLT